MGKIDESTAGTYDWDSGEVYLIEREDMVEGGEEGISNRQGKALAVRTRNLHNRLNALKEEAAEIAAELEALTTAVDTKDAATLEAAKADASVKSEAALRNAKSYTDTREGIIRTDYANADASTLVSAKTYADQVVAALVDGSLEALDTLQELAAALGNDPNFATTVMAEIGKRATTEAMNTALGGKANLNGDQSQKFYASQFYLGARAVATWFNNMFYFGETGFPTVFQCNGTLQARIGVNGYYDIWHAGNFNPSDYIGPRWMATGYDLNDATGFGVYFYDPDTANRPSSSDYGTVLVYSGSYGAWIVQLAVQTSNDAVFVRTKTNNAAWTSWKKIYHSGNLSAATTSANGLMSAADKQKLDRIGDGVTSKCCGKVSSDGTFLGGFGCSSSIRLATGKYRVYHNMGHTNYAVTVTMTQGVTDTYDNTPHIATIASTYFDVWMGTGPGTLEDTGFYFITMPYQ